MGGKRDIAHIVLEGVPSFGGIKKAAPSTKTERKVAKICHQFLGISLSDIDIYSLFETMGGNSIILIGMLSEINKQFKLDLNITELMDKLTIFDTAAYIDTIKSSSALTRVGDCSELCVTIQEGRSKHPIFFAPPGDGQALVYNKLTHMLGPDFTVFGFRMPGSQPGEAMSYYSVEDYAKMFVDILVKKQPAGPIHLIGYCAGGTIIVEMAQQLKATYGRDIQLLAMIDAPNPEQQLVFPDNETFLESFFGQTFGVLVSKQDILKFSDNFNEQIAFVVEMGKKQNIFPPNQEAEFFQRFIKMEEITRESITRYKPRPYPGKVVYFKAEAAEGMPWLPNPRKEWTPFFPNFDIMQCSGSHLEMMKEAKHCKVLADSIGPHISHFLEA